MSKSASDELMLQAKIAWLQMIQAIIARMSNYGFMLKGWGLTLVAALLALAVGKDSNANFAMLAVLPVLIFWALDGWFLQTETKFRKMYDWARQQSAIENEFEIDLKNSNVEVGNLSSFLFSRTLWPYWSVLAIVCVLVWGWTV